MTRLEDFRERLVREAAYLTEQANEKDAERNSPEVLSSVLREFRQGQCSGAAIQMRSFASLLLDLAADKEEFGVNIGLAPDGVRFDVGTTKVWP